MSRFNVMPRAKPTCDCGAPITHLKLTQEPDRAKFAVICEHEHITTGRLSLDEATKLEEAWDTTR